MKHKKFVPVGDDNSAWFMDNEDHYPLDRFSYNSDVTCYTVKYVRIVESESFGGTLPDKPWLSNAEELANRRGFLMFSGGEWQNDQEMYTYRFDANLTYEEVKVLADTLADVLRAAGVRFSSRYKGLK